MVARLVAGVFAIPGCLISDSSATEEGCSTRWLLRFAPSFGTYSKVSACCRLDGSRSNGIAYDFCALISKQELNDARERYSAAQASLEQALATRDQASASFAGSKDAIVLLVNVKPGQEVELVFKSHPGQLFHCKVDAILEATSEGQGVVSGALPSASQIGSPGILAVKILLKDDEQAVGLDLGTAGSLAIYTDPLKPIHIMSRVTMRMNKWLYFLPFM